MKDIDVQMDWRHFAKCMAVIWIVLFGVNVMVLVRTFDGIQCFGLVILSGIQSFFLAVAVSGFHAIKRDWRAGKIQPADFTVPVIVLVSILGCMAILTYLVPIRYSRHAGLAFWLFVICGQLRLWIRRKRSRLHIDSPDAARRALRGGILKQL